MFKNTQELVLTSLIGAIIIMLSVIPQLGFILIFPAVSITIVHIPVLIGVMTLRRPSAIIFGLLYGFGSLFAAYTRGTTPVDLAFVNPLISVLPRVLFTLAAYELFRGFKWLQKKMTYELSLALIGAILLGSFVLLGQYIQSQSVMSDILVYVLLFVFYSGLMYFVYSQTKTHQSFMFVTLTALFSTLIHTVLVLTALIGFKPALFNFTFGESVDLIYGIMVSNGLLEAIIAVLVVTPVVRAIQLATEVRT
ncbi:MAG: ECF transporter S component [Acholeplasmataceae bacterium]